MAHEKNHDYHILPPSIWPLLASIGAFLMLFGAVLLMHDSGPWLFLIGLVMVLYVMFGWWSETVTENQVGDHTPVVQLGLRYGFILFIMSEVMFFAAWFWSFFKHAMYPGGPEQPAAFQTWPPVGIETFDPWHLPLINTLILLCSGAAATWAHHALVHENNRKDMKNGLILAIGLGVIFTIFQAYEYSHAAFGFSGNIYGANFFMATGFHGAHVIIGTIFLFICLMRLQAGHFTPENHIGFEAASWYWHFVDVVWLFLFASIYIWGG
ncbi:cytochrome c oxidase subunit 3 [Meridianimarinicoccus aquatilis]|uniref:Cytochrome c oxidase subunit 3 n=1 Tax=Meridianimarinicoccus aquatilis TaxID=2552766 RepID=A0A4R6B589_9RHOB|nr:cytochrome c oxidase subunit 3 [Fluviibacterium aquatile]QIE40639.1 cytochrome c oxidase subunit 3 [Rhodobacteraceae bacterium SC52]TDL91148.1 cytochrome c oxidase subunit 3 [Fluviibacterium aquatile]